MHVGTLYIVVACKYVPEPGYALKTEICGVTAWVAPPPPPDHSLSRVSPALSKVAEEVHLQQVFPSTVSRL